MLSEGVLQRRYNIRGRFQPDDVVGDRESQLHSLNKELPLRLITALRESKLYWALSDLFYLRVPL